MTQTEVDLTISFEVSRLISTECLGQIRCRGPTAKRALCLDRFITTYGKVTQSYSSWIYHLPIDDCYDEPYEFHTLFLEDLFSREKVETY